MSERKENERFVWQMGMYPLDEAAVLGMTPVDDVADDIISIAANITKEVEENLRSNVTIPSSPDVFHICSPGVNVKVIDLGTSP